MSETPSPRAVTEQRGDFMLLPPMRPTFGAPTMLQQSPASFLVTRRPTAVTSKKLAHAIDEELIGRVAGRARRSRARRRSQSQPLDHLVESELPEFEELEQVPLPAPQPPRNLQAKTRSSTPPAAPALPSRAEVRRAVTSTKKSTSVSTSASAPVEMQHADPTLVELPPSTFPSIGQSAPVVRRRGGGVSPSMPVTPPELDESTPHLAEALPNSDSADVEYAPAISHPLTSHPLSEPPAIQRRQPRGRVHTPLQELEAQFPPIDTINQESVPDISSIQRRARDNESPAPAQPSISESPTATAPSATAPSATAPSATAPSATAPSTGPASPATPQPTRPTINDTPSAIPQQPTGSSTTRPATGSESPSSPQPTRPTINETTPTGIQRRARDNESPSPAQPSISDTPTATAPTATATAPSAIPQQPTGSSTTQPATGPSSPQPTRPTINETTPTGIQRRARDNEVHDASKPNESHEPASLVHPVTELTRETEPAVLTPTAATQLSPLRNEEPAPAQVMTQTPSPSVTLQASVSAESSPRALVTPAATFSGPGEVHRTGTHEPSPVNTNMSRAERPILANSTPTGIQRRARAGAGPSAGGLADLGASPQPKVQGPRQIVVPESVRQSLRATVGEPPSHVTVHEGEAAAQQANAVNAEAFTKNGHIFFASDAPVASDRGQQLLAHELTHVMQQQGRGSSMPGEHTDEGQQLEHAARRVEEHMTSGRSEPIRPVALAHKTGESEPAQLHHRITAKSDPAPSAVTESSTSSSLTGSPATRPAMQQHAPSSAEPSVFDSAVQRAAREPSRGILDGIGSATSSTWSKTRESLLGQLEQDFAGPPKSKKEADSRAKRLERQATELYPYLQRRLRAELVRDLERRGRL